MLSIALETWQKAKQIYIYIQCIFPMFKSMYEIEIVLNTFIYNFTIWVLSHFLWYINMIVAINFSKYPVNSPLSG